MVRTHASATLLRGRLGGHPADLRVRGAARVLEVGVRSVCGQTYMPRSAHPALRLPSSGRRTVELGARCAARRADAANHCGIGAARDRTCADRAPAAGGARVSLGRPPPPSAARARGHLFGEAARCRLRPRELTVRLLRSKVASSIQSARRVCAQPSVVIKARSTVLSLPVSG